MPKVYVLKDETNTSVSFHPTRADAEKDQDWWTTEGGAETTIHEVEYTPTRVGIADLLNRYAKEAS